MNRDPFYQDIIKGLEGSLDPELFERCAAALLRAIYPGLVPVRGGGDAGMDGAIADGLGQPFALITTTEQDVIGNLSKNLAARIADHDPRRKAVLATSRVLTQRRRRNLYEHAEELGFELVQIHDQAAMADLLYRSPEWCLELLGLTGEPPALSVKPLSYRPLLNQALVGRESDLTWLCNSTGDRLLVGQPGSGKSFLLHQIALTGRGLFVNSADLAKIAGGIRAQEPSALLVDDAQVSPRLLMDLKHMREDIGAAFDIVASCWPSDSTLVTNALGVSSSTRVLEPLTRDELVEVVKGVGIYGPTDLIREIVNQAEGRPGLAATLAYLCLQGATRDVLLGDALNTSLLSPFESRVGPQTKEVLSCFAVGGNSGMTMATVAEYLGLPPFELRSLVVNLASGGIIIEPSEGYLAVRPAALRHILLRDIFFSQFALPIRPLLSRVPRLGDAVYDLIAARARGGGVRDELLLELLENLDSSECWDRYAWLGKTEAKGVLHHHPEHLIATGRTLLRRVPEDTIPALLRAAIGDERPLHSTPDHPLRLLGDWVSEGNPGTEESLVRRRLLWTETQRWLLAGADSRVGLKALHYALRPDFEDHEIDPGSGNQVTLRFGYISCDNMMALGTLIPEVIETIRDAGLIEWRPLRELVEDWAHPRPTNGLMTAETRNIMRVIAVDLLQAFIPIARGHPGILRWACGLTNTLGLEIAISVDQDFEVLFPVMEAKDWELLRPLQAARARELAGVWVESNPHSVAAKISWIEQEAALADVRWPRLSSFVCAVIAEKTSDPMRWAEALRATNVPGDLIGPFLHRAALRDQPGWITLTSSCLDETEARGVAVELILTLPSPPMDLLQLTLGALTGYGNLVGSLCLRKQVPDDTLKALLNHAEREVASAAAYGEWSAEPKGTVRNLLQDDWRRTVVRSVAPEHWLIEVLRTDPSLAKEWLRARLAEDLQDYYHYDDAIVTAICVLDLNSKRELIQMLTPGIAEQQLIWYLVRDEIELYRELLHNRHMADLHLVPLGGHPKGLWAAKAKLALNAGYGPEEIAHALIWFHPEGVQRVGNESSVWSQWIEEFERLALDVDADICQIAAAGQAYASNQYQRALVSERHKAIYGYD